MLPVSDAFLAVIRGSHKAVFSATLCNPPGQFGVTPTGSALSILDGAVTLDGNAAVRAVLDLTVAERWPTTLDYLNLTPYGAEVFVTRGVELGNGSVQRAPLGYFRLSDVDQDAAPTGPLTLTGADRMAGIVDARLEEPVQFLPTATYGEVVDALVTEVYAGVVIEWDDATDATAIGRSIVAEEDRYKALLDVVQSVGKVAFFDYRGVLVIKDPPDATSPVWEASAGSDGVLVSLGRGLSREGIYNAVIATGEALDESPPVRGGAYDLDPASPTYWLGPFGKVPRFFNSPLLTTDGQCDLAAASMLTQGVGLPYAVDFTQVPNPALEPFDPVRVVYPIDLEATPHRKKETHILDRIVIPLGVDGAMTATTRLVTL